MIKEKRRKEKKKWGPSILIQSRSLSLPSGRHPSKSVFTIRKFTRSHMQMNQVHRLFNTYVWSTSTGNPHRHQVHQAEVYLWITLGRKGLLS